jgi:hypothetical protein
VISYGLILLKISEMKRIPIHSCTIMSGDVVSSSRKLLLLRSDDELMRRYTAACNFLERNNLLSIIRAHEAQDAG